MSPLPISCFIIAKNEADRIARTINSVRHWVDEVVVVDSESTDDTVRIAVEAGARVISQPWLGFGGQKRFAEDQCRNDWVLNLDADEVVTPQLKDEIVALFAAGTPSKVAYGFPVDLVYPGDERPRRWARDHWYVRLYDRRAVRFRNSPAHDTVTTGEHPIGELQSPVFHYSYRSYDDLKAKLSGRMPLYAAHSAKYFRVALLARMAIEFPVNFFKYYIGRRHCTGGLKGLRYAWISASYRYLKVAHMWRSRNSRVGPVAPTSQDEEGPVDRPAISRDPVASPMDFSAYVSVQPAAEMYPERV
ncbi:glycosyltransferase family 2 protein [Hyphomicrobium sp.]|uniref:glycosyltransferase family 2 protein n=1 Tax=Hyphomicrobium sp. TaxID=82 RepID=UPI000FBA5364|nr:glycosyltransferase family 2 protein [Hyphomicrobium sp.]RUO98004.1 MAG: glycosyltransferase family 2 protein [Hyphomicrobium sp.]